MAKPTFPSSPPIWAPLVQPGNILQFRAAEYKEYMRHIWGPSIDNLQIPEKQVVRAVDSDPKTSTCGYAFCIFINDTPRWLDAGWFTGIYSPERSAA